jgi:hypothetical protein
MEPMSSSTSEYFVRVGFSDVDAEKCAVLISEFLKKLDRQLAEVFSWSEMFEKKLVEKVK